MISRKKIGHFLITAYLSCLCACNISDTKTTSEEEMFLKRIEMQNGDYALCYTTDAHNFCLKYNSENELIQTKVRDIKGRLTDIKISNQGLLEEYLVTLDDNHAVLFEFRNGVIWSVQDYSDFEHKIVNQIYTIESSPKADSSICNLPIFRTGCKYTIVNLV
jgi:hypothetical protein